MSTHTVCMWVITNVIYGWRVLVIRRDLTHDILYNWLLYHCHYLSVCNLAIVIDVCLSSKTTLMYHSQPHIGKINITIEKWRAIYNNKNWLFWLNWVSLLNSNTFWSKPSSQNALDSLSIRKSKSFPVKSIFLNQIW